mmetsp:Transcript_11846/g.33858  ORF Transcript_11846/g.33858 Transcript_11846/m.33858 type:complete len:234 (+) Transcript_11846:741-1442(+)
MPKKWTSPRRSRSVPTLRAARPAAKRPVISSAAPVAPRYGTATLPARRLIARATRRSARRLPITSPTIRRSSGPRPSSHSTRRTSWVRSFLGPTSSNVSPIPLLRMTSRCFSTISIARPSTSWPGDSAVAKPSLTTMISATTRTIPIGNFSPSGMGGASARTSSVTSLTRFGSPPRVRTITSCSKYPARAAGSSPSRMERRWQCGPMDLATRASVRCCRSFLIATNTRKSSRR